jgi:hypothetical protein
MSLQNAFRNTQRVLFFNRDEFLFFASSLKQLWSGFDGCILVKRFQPNELWLRFALSMSKQMIGNFFQVQGCFG